MWVLSRFAFAETDCAEMVEKAKKEMDDKEIEGRRLKVRGTKVRTKDSNQLRGPQFWSPHV